MPGDILWSGYKAAASTVLSTELNSLANGQVCALSSEIDNSTNKYLLADVVVSLASLTISSTTAFVVVYFVPAVDGTNYGDWASGAVGNYHSQYLASTLLVRNVSSAATRTIARMVPVPVGVFKVALLNQCGTALPSSGNTVALRYYNYAYS